MKKILIIEDDESIAALEKDYLEVSGFEVTVAATGAEGLAEAQKGYDLIVLDIMLPEMNGFDICKTLRETINTPILMVTAKNSEIDKIKGLSLGADDYITKPFSLNEFVARVGAHIGRYERLTNHKTRQMQIRGLTIDLNARRIFVNGKEVFLANKEFDLLTFLAQNPNTVFSKDALMDKIWGYESFAETGTVTVHIKRIREKIETDSQAPAYIETVWGAGYRFRA